MTPFLISAFLFLDPISPISPYLRRALYIAASIAQRYDPILKAYYVKKRAEGKRYKEATVANARHMVYRVYAVLKRGTPYVVHS